MNSVISYLKTKEVKREEKKREGAVGLNFLF